MRRRPRQILAVLTLGALVTGTAACGARWTDEEHAAVHASRARVDPATGAANAAAIDLLPATETAVGSSVATPANGAGPLAPSAPGSADGGGSPPCEGPSGAPGITDAEVRVGSISTLSGPVPGLGQSSAAATRAYVAYLNSGGGVCGRRVVLREADDGASGSVYRSTITGMADQVLGIAGGFNIGDVGGLDVIGQHGIPVVNVPSDDHGTALPSLFDINPPYAGPDVVLGKYRHLHDQGVRTATFAYLAVAQSRAEAQRQQRLMEAAGIRIVEVQELPLATLSFDSTARRVANSGADHLFFIGDARANASMANALRDNGVQLRSQEYYAFAYGGSFLEQAGSAAEGAIEWIRTLPMEEAAASPEMGRFLEWMGRTAPGVDPDVFAAESWAGTKAFFDALQALAGPISRPALVAQLRSVGTYDAGGMIGRIHLGEEITDGCVVAMQVRDGRWQRMAPPTGFLC